MAKLSTTYLTRKKRISLIFCLFCIGGSFFAQTYVVNRYADNNGLPSRIVRDVLQDKNGFIWVAGNNGLYKFDGQSFKPFLASLKDTLGLRDNKITSLYEATDGKLWIGTPKGLHYKKNEGDIHYFFLKNNALESEEHINNIFGDNEGNIWVSTYGGLFLLDGSNVPNHFLTDNNDPAISKGTVWSVTQDTPGNIWASTNEGLFMRSDKNPFTFDRVILKYDAAVTDTDIKFYKIQQYNDSLYILDTSHGLMNGAFKNASFELSFFKKNDREFEKGYAVERSIIDREGSIWMATWKHYFKKFRVDKDHLVEEKVNSKNGFLGLSGISHSVFEDSQGNIWIADSNGLYKFSKDTTNVITFPPYDCLTDFLGIYSIIEDKGKNLWITTPEKLYRFKKEDLLQNNCPDQYLVIEERGMEQARNLFIDSENRLWISADGGLFVTQLDSNFNPGSFRRYTTEDGLPHNRTYEIHQTGNNSFWVGNYHGFLRLVLKPESLDVDSIKIFKADRKRENQLVNSQSYEIESDNHDNLWIGTFSGVSRLIAKGDDVFFSNYTSDFGNFNTLSNNSIKKIYNDTEGRLWIATQRGLNLYRPKEDNFLQFGHAEGMPSEYIIGIAEDSQGYMWICSTNGVLRARYDNLTKTFKEQVHYTSNDGLADNIPYKNAIHVDKNDHVFIGSRDGISIIKGNIPVTMNGLETGLALTTVEATQKKEVGFKSVMGKIKDGMLELPYNSNSLKIHYVILDFINPENNSYRHKLLPQNDSWIETDKISELNYYNLPPGEYELIMDAANSRGQWSNRPMRLDILINPPFWKTQWALFGYSILIAGVILMVYRIRIRKKEREWEQKAAMEAAIINQREQLRKENAADFHDELGSMLTKISMFLTMAERNLEGNKDPRPFFKKIRANTKGLSTGFRDLLWVIDPQKDSLADTFLRLKEFGEDLFEQSGINFTTSEFKEKFTERVLNPKSKKQVVMIFKEAMNNCLKYSNASESKLILTTNGRFSKMEFSDNGLGFDIAKKSKGRGLTNMRTRAEKMDAILTIESSPRGTTIILDRIPHTGDAFSDVQT